MAYKRDWISLLKGRGSFPPYVESPSKVCNIRNRVLQAAGPNVPNPPSPAAAANGGGGGAGGVSLWSRWPDGPTLQAACGVLCAAAGAVLPGVLAGDAALQHHFAWLWPQLIALLGNKNPEVGGNNRCTRCAEEHWSGLFCTL